LITSYWTQSLTETELVIVDDQSGDATPELCAAAQRRDARIRYVRNPTNIGFCANLRESLVHATASCAVILGDDDLLLGDDALRRVARVFAEHPSVWVAYPNLVQLDAAARLEFGYQFFSSDRLFRAGAEAHEGMWLQSHFIGGLSLRLEPETIAAYPGKTMLFPQVEMVGELLRSHDGFGIADFLVGARAHDDQLGFHANKGSRIKGREQHSTVETLEIARRLAGRANGPKPEFTETWLAKAYVTMLPAERLQSGARRTLSRSVRFLRTSRAARRSPLLWASLAVSLFSPPFLLRRLRSIAKRIYARRSARLLPWYDAVASQHREVDLRAWPADESLAKRGVAHRHE
jgi:glycosyltransferase involved in cell wall biosynthesis